MPAQSTQPRSGGGSWGRGAGDAGQEPAEGTAAGTEGDRRPPGTGSQAVRSSRRQGALGRPLPDVSRAPPASRAGAGTERAAAAGTDAEGRLRAGPRR